MRVTRRQFAACALAASRVAGAGRAPFRIGVTDWTIGLSGNPDSLRVAARLGLDGVEISLGPKPVGERLLLDDAQLLARYAAAAREHRVSIACACIDILNQVCLKDNPGAEKWLREGIRLAAKLGARVLLVPFFGRDCALETAADRSRVADVLKEVGPAAQAAGVRLGMENWLTAEDNARILERSGTAAAGVFYDVGNSTRAGHDAVREIRWLGAARIAQIHLKQHPPTGRLNEGSVDLPGVCRAMREIGFAGFASLETRALPETVEREIGQDLAYLRGLL